jgi:type I restriction enzyme S subunit
MSFNETTLYSPPFPSHWKKVPLYKLANWLNGLAFKPSELEQIGIPVIKISEVKSGISDQTKRTSKHFDSKYLLKKGDMLFCWSGQPQTSIDTFWWSGPDGWLNQHIFKVSPNENLVERNFFYYLLKYIKPSFIGIASNKQTTGLGHVTRADLQLIQVALPSFEVQKNIVSVIEPLDDRITLLRETNTTLEAIAKALFKSWFVDFDPVRAKSEGKLPEGMDETTAALFPDAFEETGLGMVPKGWRVQKFEDFIERLPVGKKFDQKTALVSGDIPILDQGKSGIIGFHNEAPSVKANLDAPVIVFANHTCYMRLICFDFSAIQNVLPFIGKGVDTVWAFYKTKDRIKFSEYKGHWPDFVIKKTVVPTEELTHLYRRSVDWAVRRMQINEMQAETLVDLRDTLLPRLISGQLSITDAKAEIEKVSA